MTYVHIPVDFKEPTEEKFNEFCAVMAVHQDKPIWVHCAANMRVSAFVYRYRVSILGLSKTVAQLDLAGIWQPFGVWKQFIAKS